jgi:glycosyltransferase involved in cell wall biosynthesis
MKKTKILFLIGKYSVGGKERQLAELIKGLPKEEYSITLVAKTADAHYLETIINNINLVVLNQNIFGLRCFVKLFQIIYREKPDIVHSWVSIGTIFMLLTKIILRFKLIDGSIRDTIPPIKTQKIFRKIINAFTDIIVSNSREGLVKYNVPKSKGKVIYNGFDMSRSATITNPYLIKERWNIQTKYIVGMVARIDQYKDYPTFIKTANKILSTRDDVSFIIVGDGVDYSKIKSLVEHKNSEKIIFTGIQSKVEELINTFDIGILSSFCEGISNSIMEYMSLAKPVIATDSGGTKELVINNETGFLVSVGDVADFARKINFLLENPDKRHQYGNMGLNRIKNYFGLQKMISEYDNVYRHQLTMK